MSRTPICARVMMRRGITVTAIAILTYSFAALSLPLEDCAAEPAASGGELVWLGAPRGAVAREKIEAGSPLIGIDVWVGTKSWENFSPVIDGVTPIYSRSDAPKTGPYGLAVGRPIRIEAKPGYAVSGLVGRVSDRIDGFRLVFMRLHDGHFDPQDRYESRWVGGRGSGTTDIRVAGDGKPIVGLICHFEYVVRGITLVEDAKDLAEKSVAVAQAVPTEKLVPEIERRGGKVVRDPKDPAHPIVEIDWSDSQLHDGDIALLRGLASLKRLDLSRGFNEFTEQGERALETLVNLEKFDFTQNFGRTSQLVLHLRSLKHLKSLDLAGSNDANFTEYAPILGSMTTLERLSLTNHYDDTSMEHFSKLTNLRELELRDTQITDAGAEHLRKLTKLRDLTIITGVMGDEGLASLEDLHDLEQLTLGGYQLTSAALAHVKAPKLRDLTLIGHGFDEGVVQYLQTMPSLEQIHLYGVELRDNDLSRLNALKHLKLLNLEQCDLTGPSLSKLTELKELKSLRLAENPLEGSALTALKNFPALEVLELRFTHVTADSLVHLRDVPGLRELSVAAVPIGDGALEHLEPLKNLEVLQLPNAHLSGSGLKHLKGLKKLRHLELQVNSITDDAAADLLAELPNLRLLNMEQTGAGDATLAAVAKLPNLESLLLPRTLITDQGVAHLDKATKLRELNLSNPRLTGAVIAPLLAMRDLRLLGLSTTQITDPDVDRLAELPNLRTLYIGATRVSNDAVRRLWDKSPRIKIFRNYPQTPERR